MLFGDLVDLVAKFVVKGFERLLDAGGVQCQARDRTERGKESEFLVLVGHAASFRSEDQHSGKVAAVTQRCGCLATQGDHGVGGRVGRGGQTNGVRDPEPRNPCEALDERVVAGQ